MRGSPALLVATRGGWPEESRIGRSHRLWPATWWIEAPEAGAFDRPSLILNKVVLAGGRSDRGLTKRYKHRGERRRRCVRPLSLEDRKLEIRQERQTAF